MSDLPSPEAFIARWEASGAAERANYALFLAELCDVLGVEQPHPTVPDDACNAYVFERAVTFQNGDGTTSGGRIDLYKRACFVLEAKQGVSGEGADREREREGERERAGPGLRGKRGHGRRGTGAWDDAMLRAHGQAQQYAKAIAEAEEWPPFLIGVDVGLIREDGFTQMLESLREEPQVFPEMAQSLWAAMDRGEFSPTLRQRLLRFNGGLFESTQALPLTAEQLALLIETSRAVWKDVEPAIFGTLLERALDPLERHRLGAHYTPRAYVERLVLPTLVEPLREEWEAARAAAVRA